MFILSIPTLQYCGLVLDEIEVPIKANSSWNSWNYRTEWEREIYDGWSNLEVALAGNRDR